MVVVLAGLQGIPQDLREAAMVDGANRWRSFRHVTLPLLTPVLFFQLIMGLIGSLQIFVEPLLMSPTRSGYFAGMSDTPLRSLYMYLNHVMIQMLAYRRFGYATALLWILFVLLLALSLGVFKSSRYWVHYELEQ